MIVLRCPTPIIAQMRSSASRVACALLLPVLWMLVGPQLGLPLVAQAYADGDDKPALGVVHFIKRGDAGLLSVQRIEEYLRQMLDAGAAVKVLPAKVLETGKPLTGASAAAVARDRPVSPQAKAIDKADKLVTAARDIVAEGEAMADAGKMLGAAAQRYEQNFVELADFSKLVDCYALLAQVALAQNDNRAATDNVSNALAIQPSFVVDGRKQNKDLKSLVDTVREALEAKPRTELTVDASQPESEVFVDGVKIGTAPATAKDLLPGTHYVQVRKVGAAPYGQALVAKGKPLQMRAVLSMEVSPENEISVSVSPDDIKEYANKGTFHEKIFKNSAALFSKQIGASHLLFGLVNKRPTALELHLYLYGAKAKKTCAIDKIEYAANLTNLQMQTLDAEGRVRSALQTCTNEVTAPPPLFAAEKPDEPAAPEIVPTPPDPEPRVDPRDDPKPEPEPKRVEPKRTEPKRTEPRVVPEDPYAGLLKDNDGTSEPVYKTWWFWTAVGVAVAGGTAGGLLLRGSGGNAVTGYGARVVLP